jgi:hypothetical protein
MATAARMRLTRQRRRSLASTCRGHGHGFVQGVAVACGVLALGESDRGWTSGGEERGRSCVLTFFLFGSTVLCSGE